ncbi:hypothetical protein [Pseudomonas sp. VI4.1]|uniref:hypothetical protein n=1 Tax=Pseudomonas sp. VI4.1 TaxID=1941346 RepID=UPI0009CB17B1|nr:hypothetical protein [Pseudomonas sp. VI4.1]OPK11863.1 hypothetical protein BZ163_01670 [Pseudomonas sp. VI4.1]
MNEQLFVLASQKKKTNHLLHLLLCIPTLGFWAIVWIVVASVNHGKNVQIDHKINSLMHYKSQGMTDNESYQQLKTDNSSSNLATIRIVFIVIAVVFVYFALR